MAPFLNRFFGYHMYALFFLLFLTSIQTLFGQYYGQVEQDKFLNETYFQNRRGGTFVEFGAYDGVKISNSYFFEKELGWTGICIEPIAEHFKKLKENRHCFCVQGCVAPRPGTVDFLKISGGQWFNQMLSGIVSSYDPRHIDRVRQEVARFHATVTVIQVPCYRLTDLLDQHSMPHVNYLSIDTEGGELEILQSIDFKKYQIDFITVEDNYNDVRLQQFLESQGFELIKRLSHDLVFKHRNWKK